MIEDEVAEIQASLETVRPHEMFLVERGRMEHFLTTLVETRAALERLLDVCRYVGPDGDNPLLYYSWDYAKAEARRVLGEA